MKPIYILCGIVVLLYLCATIHYYDIEKATSYLTEHAEPKSQGSCAMYVRLAIKAGGCPIYPRCYPASANEYDTFLPKLGFKEIDLGQYHPQKGDIIVIKAHGTHKNGHIAMYNGKCWISDFVQRDMFGSNAYREKGTEYHLYRKKQGWGMRKVSGT